jgi:soluble lytic murein transglycosylase-like protein
MELNIRQLFLTCAFLLAGMGAGQGQTLQGVSSRSLSAVEQQRQALLKQRASLEQQVGLGNLRSLLGATFYGIVPRPQPQLVPIACPRLDSRKREELIDSAARANGLDPDLLRAVMHRESDFRPCATSPKGALGLMQLMPSTIAQFHVMDPFDPTESTRAGAALLRNLLDRYQGDLKLTLAAYNAGAGRVDNLDPDSYPAETKDYIDAILAELRVTANPADSMVP